MGSDLRGLTPLVSRDRSLDWRKKLQILAYLTTFGICLQCYNRGLSRVIRALRRGLTAAVAAYLEDRGGMKLFTLEDDLESMPPLDLRTPFAQYSTRFGTHLDSGSTTPQSEAGSGSNARQEDLPNFFESAKLFSCLETEVVNNLYASSSRVTLAPNQPLFSAGDDSSDGLYIVTQGRLDIFVASPEDRGVGAKSLLVNTLTYGESVGDLDILDGARRSVGARAAAEGCVLVQVPRELFVSFILTHPSTLLVYLQLAIARLWRVASFALLDILQLPLEDFRGLEMAFAIQSLPVSLVAKAEVPSVGSAPSSPTNRVGRRPSILKDAQGSRSAAPRNASPMGVMRRVSFHSEQASPFKEIAAAGYSSTGYLGSPVNLARAAAAAASLPRDTACLRDGWDVVAPHESGLREETWDGLAQGLGQRIVLSPLEVLHDCDEAVHAFYVLLEGSMVAERKCGDKDEVRSASVAAGSLLSCAAFLSATRSKCSFAAGLETCVLAAFGNQELVSLINNEGPNTEEQGWDMIKSPQSPIIEDFSRRSPTGSFSSALGSPTASLQSFPMLTTPEKSPIVMGGSPSGSTALPALARVDTGKSSDTKSYPRSQAARDLARRSLTSNLGLVERAGGILAPSVSKEDMGEERISQDGTQKGCLLDEVQEDTAAGEGKEEFLRNVDTRSDRPINMEGSKQMDGSPGTKGAGTPPYSRTTTTKNPAHISHRTALYVDILLAASRSLGPIIRQFSSLGLNRVWRRAGDVVYRQGDMAECMYVMITGRARLLHRAARSRQVTVEDDIGRGESVGAVWALAGGKHDTSCLCIRDAELCRLTRGSFELICALHPRAAARLLQDVAERLAVAQASRAARVPADFTDVRSLTEASVWKKGGGKRRGEIVTIAVIPAGRPLANNHYNGGQDESGVGRMSGQHHHPSSTTQAKSPVQRLATQLREMLDLMWGPTLLLDGAAIAAAFPTTHSRLKARFYRSKICAWLAAQEEEYRFIILVGDERDSPWSRICASQSDCTLLVADPACAAPQVSPLEQSLVWKSISRAASLVNRTSTLPDLLADAAWQLLGQEGIGSLLTDDDSSSLETRPDHVDGAASLGLSALMRVELVLVHGVDSRPSGTAAWLNARPLLTRHHHIRLGYDPDLARLSRWMADRAVGVVLSGGGSRGLAHLGVLNALMDAGVPIDVVGGTSQGAFMGGLFAQNRRRASMERAVRRYATEMGSVRKLLSDLTLPVISVFHGGGFDRVVREALGDAKIEDLWLRFFCVSTNLSRGAPSVHERGPLWKMCRASMTIVGLVPPVFHNGDLLVDGGYLNNIPVDVIRGMGVGTVLVVDVEDRDQSAWHNLAPYDGGLSGWQLLWDRWCPIKAWRFNVRIPRYSQLVNSLTWMSHQQNLRRVSQEYVIDLYLRPPVTHYRLMDYYLAEKIVREASQYAWVVVSEWQARVGIYRTGLAGLLHPSVGGDNQGESRSMGGSRMMSPPADPERSQSSACMTQLRGKQQRHRWAYSRSSLSDEDANRYASQRLGSLPLPLRRPSSGQGTSMLASTSFPPPVILDARADVTALSAPASPTAQRLATLVRVSDSSAPSSPLAGESSGWSTSEPDLDAQFSMSDVTEQA